MIITLRRLVFTLGFMSLATSLLGNDGPVYGDLKGQVLATGTRILLMDSAGKELWQHPGGNCHDIWMLDNGNVLFANGEIIEVDPKTDKVVFKYTPEATKGGGAYACQRLDNGNTVVGENSAGRITEVDPAGKVVFKLDLPMISPGNHHNLRMVRKLDNGNYLVCHSKKRLVREYTPSGEVKFEVTVDTLAFSAVRLPNGNTMVGHISGVTEYSSDGKVLWTFSPKDLPEVSIGKITGIHVQPNGNIALGIYGIKKGANGAEFLEITHDKKLVWRYLPAKPARWRMSVQVLTADGKPVPGKVLR
ncbi:hypothetical protein BVY04_04480 [bacterium M21]|nr:hypothetical protein BVY04_04480 [bacterium M21]